MTAIDRFPRRFRSMLAVPALLVMASCGTDDGLGKRYPVSGTVTYNGNPLEKGDISFVSEDLKNNFGATGIITNGSYTLSTGGNDDGAQAGKYKVTITPKKTFSPKPRQTFRKSREEKILNSPRSTPQKPKRQPKASSPPATAIRAPRPSRPRSRHNPTRSTSRSPTPTPRQSHPCRRKAKAAKDHSVRRVSVWRASHGTVEPPESQSGLLAESPLTRPSPA